MKVSKAALRVGSICMKMVIFLLICVILICLGQTTYRYTRAAFNNEAMESKPGRTVKVMISETVSIKEFAKVLEEKGLVQDAAVFLIQMKMEDFGDVVEAGTYELNTSMTPTEMIRNLSKTNEDET